MTVLILTSRLTTFLSTIQARSNLPFRILAAAFPGTSVAIVEPLGAGKITLIDVLLGVFNLDVDTIQISGLQP